MFLPSSVLIWSFPINLDLSLLSRGTHPILCELVCPVLECDVSSSAGIMGKPKAEPCAWAWGQYSSDNIMDKHKALQFAKNGKGPKLDKDAKITACRFERTY